MDIKACPKGSLLHYATEDIFAAEWWKSNFAFLKKGKRELN